jgi:hypothetical protein
LVEPLALYQHLQQVDAICDSAQIATMSCHVDHALKYSD